MEIENKYVKREDQFIKTKDKSTSVSVLKAIIVVLVVSIEIIVLGVKASDAVKLHKSYDADKHELIEKSAENRNIYFDLETKEYLLEVFPIGKVDVEGTNKGIIVDPDERLIKTTWFNKKRDTVIGVDYSLIRSN